MVLLNRIVFLLLTVSLSLQLYSQADIGPMERRVMEISGELKRGNVFNITNLRFDKAPHIAVSIKCRPDDFQHLRMFDEGSNEWKHLEKEPHLSYSEYSFSHLFHLKSVDDLPPIRTVGQIEGIVEVHLFNPGYYDPGHFPKAKPRNTDCECESPEILDRDGWCSQCPAGGDPISEKPEFIIVHHSAGVNSSSDWPAIVRSIWDFHVNVRGWDDIGYNYLIDPNGQIYLGRGEDILGAHFCGHNSQTLGVCMLGTYIDVLPPALALQQLKSITAWQNCKLEISPTEIMYHSSSEMDLFGLSGHRDGCATQCPGQKLYEQLPELRDEVQWYMDTCDMQTTDSMLILSGRLINSYTAILNWDPLPENVENARLEYRDESGKFLDKIDIKEHPDSLVIFLKADEKYVFQIHYALAGSGEKVSNMVELITPSFNPSQAEARIFPNPARNEISLQMTNDLYGPFALAIFDMKGKRMLQKMHSKEGVTEIINWNLAALPSGMYLLVVNHRNFQYKLKFILVE